MLINDYRITKTFRKGRATIRYRLALARRSGVSGITLGKKRRITYRRPWHYDADEKHR